ncbi:MAG: hypothetical protein WB760_02800 [Xanthobacteraceae bacterium]
MTEPLIIEGLTYLSIADAAAESQLSKEYLARLARKHRLRARMVANMWFIENRSLQQFLSTRTAAARSPHHRHRSVDTRGIAAEAGY